MGLDFKGMHTGIQGKVKLCIVEAGSPSCSLSKVRMTSHPVLVKRYTIPGHTHTHTMDCFIHVGRRIADNSNNNDNINMNTRSSYNSLNYHQCLSPELGLA